MPLVRPHGGGALKPLLLAGAELAAEKERAATLPALVVAATSWHLFEKPILDPGRRLPMRKAPALPATSSGTP